MHAKYNRLKSWRDHRSGVDVDPIYPFLIPSFSLPPHFTHSLFYSLCVSLKLSTQHASAVRNLALNNILATRKNWRGLNILGPKVGRGPESHREEAPMPTSKPSKVILFVTCCTNTHTHTQQTNSITWATKWSVIKT